MYNWKIIGHKKQLQSIEQDIASNNLAHAYLFAGPSRIGKFSIAKMFVNILQCPNNLCHTCPVCLQIQKGSHPDTIILDNTDESVKIEQIREIIGRLSMTKQGRYKILLIKQAGRLTPEAANCLLKTLEEPPPDTLIIMTSDNPRELLSTVVSRARLVKFSGYSQKYLEEKMQEQFPDADSATISQVCSLSIGKSGRAIKLLRNADLLAAYKSMYNVLCELLEDKPLYRKFTAIEDLLKSETDISEFLDVFVHLIRSRLYKSLEEDDCPGKKRYYLDILEDIEQTRQLLKRNINARLALENLVLKASI